MSTAATGPPVAVLGLGIMGAGVAAHLVREGRTVVAFDPDQIACRRAMGRIEGARSHASAGAVVVARTLEDAVRDADLVFECVPEDLRVKRSVIREVCLHATGRAPVASNTSTFDIDQLAEGVRNPGRVIGCHWFNPPEIAPGVEVVAGAATDEEVTERLIAFLATVGRQAIRAPNRAGFVANRLQEAMAAEALRLIHSGAVGVKEVDEIVRTTFGFRLAVCGPFEILDQIGLQTEVSGLAYMREQSENGGIYAVPPVLEQLLSEGREGLAGGRGFYDYDDAEAEMAWRQQAYAAVIASASEARRHRPNRT